MKLPFKLAQLQNVFKLCAPRLGTWGVEVGREVGSTRYLKKNILMETLLLHLN